MAAAIGHVLSQHWIVLADIEGVADLRDERVGDGCPAKAVGRDSAEQAVPLFCLQIERPHLVGPLLQVALLLRRA